MNGSENRPERKHWIDYIALFLSLAALVAAFWPTITARYDVRVFLDFTGTNGSVMFLNPGTETAVITEVSLYWGSLGTASKPKGEIERLVVEPFVLRPSDAATRSISLDAPVRMLKWERNLERPPQPERKGIYLRRVPPEHIVSLAKKGEPWPMFVVVMAKDMNGDEYRAEFEIGMGTDESGDVDQTYGFEQTKRLVREGPEPGG